MRNESEAFHELTDRMLPRLLSINPDCATVFGRHDPYDAHLPHGGLQRIRDNLDLLDEWGKEADEIGAIFINAPSGFVDIPGERPACAFFET